MRVIECCHYFNVFIFLFLVNLDIKHARELTKNQQYSQNSDFLQHESGNGASYKFDQTQFPALNSPSSKSPNILESSDFPPLNPSKKQDGANGRRDYVAPSWPKSPSTPSPSTPSLTSLSTKQTPKRDYVAPQVPTKSSTVSLPSHSTLAPSMPTSSTANGKRDYVAPQFPTLKPPSTPNAHPTVQPSTISSSGKRDYVAPHWPTLPPTSGSASTFTSNKNTAHPQTPKPISFSEILSGSNKPSSPPVTRKPLSVTTLKSVVPKGSTKGPVLPSSIVNSNKNNNQGKDPTDQEILTLSEELLKKDTNNAAKHITVNYQEKTTSFSKDDKASQPLFTIPDNVWNMPTIQKFLPLLDNYEWDTLVNEHVTPQERNEENAFMDAIMSTSVIRYLMNFLKEKGYVTPDPKQQRDFLKQLWFSLYSRGKGKISSSGFEHIFVSELKNGEVSGLHNWIYFAKQEALNRVNYLGFLRHTQFSDKGAVLKFHFTQQGVDKPVDTMFIGTSPELEMALYTLCFVTRADKDCDLKLGGKNIRIVSHTFRYRSKNLIGSAYPQILD